jgi:hypothetical protein
VSAKQKSQRGFVAVTLITVLAIALVIVVYATILGTFTGGNVNVVTLRGSLWYNQTDSAPWQASLNDVENGTAWYVMFNTTSSGYAGLVSITWQLQFTNGTNVGNSVSTTSFTLTGGSGQEIFASTSGTQTGNTNWGTLTIASGTYRIKMTVQTA